LFPRDKKYFQNQSIGPRFHFVFVRFIHFLSIHFYP
jgi:hypothetical protein